MKRITLRALGVLAAALLSFTLPTTPAHADDGASASKSDMIGLFSRRKVGRSGQVYCWKKDC